MAHATYPVHCRSSYCGRIRCHGCKFLPVLQAWKRSHNPKCEDCGKHHGPTFPCDLAADCPSGDPA